jgi:hypothetical protein
MQKIIFVIITVIIGIIVLFTGFCIGSLSNTSITNTAIVEKDAKLQTAINALSSGMVVSAVAQGNVTKISGKTLTLTSGTDSMDILIADNAQIFSFAPSGTASNAATPTKVNFLSIKTGDQLNVNIQVSASGDIQGTSVLIIPPATNQ